MTKVFNKFRDKRKRRELRNQMPSAEVLLWSKLKGRQLSGVKFRRQFGVGAYVLDFYCPDVKVAVEIDGDSHFRENAREYDHGRQKSIEQMGIHFLRFTNLEIYKNIAGVVETIADTVKKAGSPTRPRRQ